MDGEAQREEPGKPEELVAGSKAYRNLVPYNAPISHNFELPRHVGQLISSWDNPQFVSAPNASHLREDDYVVGLVHKGVSRAYPLWIADYYHVINDWIADDPVVFVTCERCQSGAAFIAEIGSASRKFGASGMYNATLLMTDRSRGTRRPRTLWLHYEGVGIHGESEGVFLPMIPTFHTTWLEWLKWHPGTMVMLPPRDPQHRDCRHGHGREEYFSRPGMDRPLVQTIAGKLDTRYPENEMVLALNLDGGVKAYPLREVKLIGGVVEDELSGHPLVVLAGPEPDGFTMTAYSRTVGSQVLSFELKDGAFVDRETASRWTIEGEAVDGPLAGQTLTALRWHYLRWHAWAHAHPTTELFRYEGPLPVYPAVLSHLEVDSFEPVLSSLAGLGRPLVAESVIPRLQLPHEAEKGLRFHVGKDRLNLYLFGNREAAEDYVALEGAWYCPPIAPKVARRLSCRMGRLVLESDPEIQFADPAQIVRLPDPQIAWADLLTEEERLRQWKTLQDEPGPGVCFSGLLEHLRGSGYDLVDVAFLPHSQLRVGTVSGIAAVINADRFCVYKCCDPDAARAVARDLPHSLAAGSFVFHSTPLDMYRDPFFEIGQLPEDEIGWSLLVGDRSFAECVGSYPV